MPRQTKIMKVFVSSPSDVTDERIRLESIIDKVNKELGSNSDFQLRLIKSETDVTPGIGKYPQDVINKQINDDYDIFIGILWKRFGTPTNVAHSGTEEEFNRAYERNTLYQGSVRIKFYFNEAFVNPYEINPEQFDLVKNFRNSLGGKGVLWSTYKGIDDFEEKVRLHLHEEVNNSREEYKAKNISTTKDDLSKSKEISEQLLSWELLFEHDENGHQIEGNLEHLINAIFRGCPIRIRVHHPNSTIQIMDAPLLSIENGVVYASDIDQISKTKDGDGNYIYQDKPYHYYVIASSNGHFHAKRVFLDGTSRNTTSSKRHIAWIGLMPQK